LPEVVIRVASRVRLSVRGASLTGNVRPVLAGATVAVQRKSQRGWKTVARVPVDARGAFVVALRLRNGTYRARLAPTGGLLAGVSAPVEIPAP
jgi:hypothetical protein